MNREQKLWLLGAGGVAVVVVAVVLVFGLSFAPEFPGLYEEDGPTIQGLVAYVDYGPQDCIHLLNVATGESQELYCDQAVWLGGWDEDGNLRIHRGNGHYEELLIVDPMSGAVLGSDEFRPDEEPPLERPRSEVAKQIRASSHDGHATLRYGSGDAETLLIDVEGSRDYAFWDYGVTTDEEFAWVCDSEGRLLAVALDGTDGPWIVADDINEPMWK